MKEIDYIVDLLSKYLEDKKRYASDDDFLALLQKYPFLNDVLHEFENKEDVKNTLQQFFTFSNSKSKNSEDRMLAKILNEVRTADSPRRNKFGRAWLLSAAACVLLLIVAGLLWKIKALNFESESYAVETFSGFEPGKNKAVLRMGDGRLIELSSDHQGIVSGDNLFYNDGTLLASNFSKEGVVSRFMLSTPKGGQYQVVLSDGTKVWLNAESTLTYPSEFSATTREVEVEGEVYFEVAKNIDRPFIVKTRNETVEVLGTHFNVCSYESEPMSTVSLTEGSVRVSIPEQLAVTIKPGQQTVVKGDRLQTQNINVEEAIAWKNGEFMFNNENLESVVRKLARWYDLDIEVSDGLKNISIWGAVSRYDNFNRVLDIIKMTDKDIQFKVEGRRVQFMK